MDYYSCKKLTDVLSPKFQGNVSGLRLDRRISVNFWPKNCKRAVKELLQAPWWLRNKKTLNSKISYTHLK